MQPEASTSSVCVILANTKALESMIIIKVAESESLLNRYMMGFFIILADVYSAIPFLRAGLPFLVTA